MTCPACAKSATELCAMFHAGCRQCQARALSRTPWYTESRERRALTPTYRGMLQAAGLTHDEVKAAAAADFEGKR